MAEVPLPPPLGIKSTNKKIWKDPIQNRNCIQFDTAIPREINTIEWKNLRAIQKSAGGSNGIWFVDIPKNPTDTEQQLLVVKSSGSMAADIFAYHLGNAMGVSLPHYRVLTPDTDELYQATLHCLQQLTIQVNGSLPKGREANNLSTLMVLGGTTAGAGTLNRPFYLLLEYIPHIDGEHTAQNPEMVRRILAMDEGTTELTMPLGDSAVTHLQQIGRIMALDCILNNFDRIPIGYLWKYELEREQPVGNLGNLLFRRETGMPVAIDQSLTSIDPNVLPERYSEYSGNLQSIVKRCVVALENKETSEDFREVENVLSSVFGFHIGDIGMSEVQRGFISALKKVSKLKKDEVQLFYDSTFSLFANAIENYPDMSEMTVGLHLINLSYILRLTHDMQAHLPS